MLAVVAAVLTGGSACGGDSASRPSKSRQEQVAARGALVMPFDLDATTHTFRQTSAGGAQTVTVDDPSDETNLVLARRHLRAEAERFARGDLGDPAEIHGHDMPGLAAIEAGASAIRVSYSDVPNGGRITYTTTDPALVDALHAWFDAQVADHGAHALSG
jgi:hypothetical protein